MCCEPETTGRRRGLCGIVCLSPGRTVLREPGRVCVYCSVQLLFITAVPNTELCARGGRRKVEDMCYVCFITAGPITKLCAWGEEL